MKPEIKGNEHIRGDEHAFFEAYERAREQFRQIEGVIDVGFGRKETGGDFTSDVALLVYVREKKGDDDLPPAQRVPPTFEGYRTDVRIVQAAEPEACDNTAVYATVQGGIQIEPTNKMATPSRQAALGTLSCIVRKRGAGGSDVYLLASAHVLDPSLELDEVDIEPAHRTGPGDLVFHPFVDRKAGPKGKLIAVIEERGIQEERPVDVPFPAGGTIPLDVFIDAGLARLETGSQCFCAICSTEGVAYDSTLVEPNPLDTSGVDTNRVKGIRDVFYDTNIVLEPDTADHLVFDETAATDANRVFKVGRTTGVTVGIVTGVRVPLLDQAATIRNHGNPVWRHQLIEIALDPFHPTSVNFENCRHRDAFSEPGDSGALVLDKDNKAIGMIFGGPQTPLGGAGPGANRLLKYAIPITAVCEVLDIDILTTTPAPTAQLPEVEGKVLFASLGATAAEGPGSSRASMPLRGAPNTHMHALAERFRQTARGRELYDAFAQHHREIGYLVRKSRPVKAAWHRNRGPAFLVHLLNHLRGDGDTMPRTVDGVSREMLLSRMAQALTAHGSGALLDTIARHMADLPVLAEAESVDDAVARLRRAELAAEPDTASFEAMA